MNADLNKAPKIAIVILNWNGGQDTIECLESLFQIVYPNFQVIVVDNGSTDDSVAKIQEWAEGKIPVAGKYTQFRSGNKPIPYQKIGFKDIAQTTRGVPLQIICLPENLGFAKGNNVGIRLTLGDDAVKYVFLLNNDTAVKADFLTKLLEGFHLHKKTALTVPMPTDYATGEFNNYPLYNRYNFFTYLLYLTPLSKLIGRLWIALVRISGQFKKPTQIYGLTGSAMLFDKGLLVEIGLLDESTFLGWEEFIVAEKLRSRGYKTYFMPDSIIYHKIGQSTKKMESVDKALAFIKSENYFQDKYFKMAPFPRFFLRSTRWGIYAFRALFNQSYRNKFIEITRAIFKKRGEG